MAWLFPRLLYHGRAQKMVMFSDFRSIILGIQRRIATFDHPIRRPEFGYARLNVVEKPHKGGARGVRERVRPCCA
jgi:hypothetical protein